MKHIHHTKNAVLYKYYQCCRMLIGISIIQSIENDLITIIISQLHYLVYIDQTHAT